MNPNLAGLRLKQSRLTPPTMFRMPVECDILLGLYPGANLVWGRPMAHVIAEARWLLRKDNQVIFQDDPLTLF